MGIYFEDSDERDEIYILDEEFVIGKIERFIEGYLLDALFSFDTAFEASDLRAIADKLDELNGVKNDD